MIKNIEKLGTKLQRCGLPESEIFGNREIHVLEARPVNLIASEITESARGIRKRIGIQIAG